MVEQKKHLLIIFLLGLSIRLITSFYFQSQSLFLGYLGYDESVYLSLAKHMAETTPLSYTLRDSLPLYQSYRVWYLDAPLFQHPPLFVWILYIWQGVFGSEVLVSRLLNVFIGSAEIIVTYLIGNRFSHRTGLVSALFIAVSPLNIQLSVLILMDMLLAILSAIFILSAIRLSEEKSNERLIFCGIVLGMILWTKYYGILVFLFLIAYTFYGKISKSQAALVLITAIIVFFPWLVWNYLITGSPVPIQTWRIIMGSAQIELPIYAYMVFLPLIVPFTLPGIISILSLKKNALRSGLTAFIIMYLLVFSALREKEMRYLLPVISPLSILSADLINSKDKRTRILILALILIATAISGIVILRGGYYWYLPFWHYSSFVKAISLQG